MSKSWPAASSRYCCVRTLTRPAQCERIIRSAHSTFGEPVSSGLSDFPSSGFSDAMRTPHMSASVGSRSTAPAICVTRLPAAILPGQRMKNDERTPPSSVEPFLPFMPPSQRQVFGPLSVK